jgi:hypothetical protein
MKKLTNGLLVVGLGGVAVAAGWLNSSPAKGHSDNGEAANGETTDESASVPLPPHDRPPARDPSVGSEKPRGPASVPILPDSNGWVERSSNSLGIQGAWYPYGDGTDGTVAMGKGSCQAKGKHADSDCSAIVAPVPGAGTFAPSDRKTGRMCTSGVVARVADIVVGGANPTPDYNNMWGAGIGLDLAGATGDRSKGSIDVVAKRITGFSFAIDNVPSPGLRVELATRATDGSSAGHNYWGATAAYPPSPVKAGTNTVHWADFVGPKGTGTDTGHVQSIQFHVPTTTASTESYSFCISNLTMLTN